MSSARQFKAILIGVRSKLLIEIELYSGPSITRLFSKDLSYAGMIA